MSTSATGFRAGAGRGISPAVLWAMSAGAAIAVANLYYAQPLLPQIAHTFALSARAMGFVVTLSQIGYALGLLFLVPIGDVLERRGLIQLSLYAVALALAAMALARNPYWPGAAALLVGFATITPQLIIPFGAHLARPEERGRVVGTVMSGLLVGILLARSVSGAIGQWLGWRPMYWIAAAMMLALAAVLGRLLPASHPEEQHLDYGALMKSLIRIAREEPLVLSSGLLGAMSFAAFSGFWTVLPFFLAGAPYHYGSGVVGLFGLVGLTGIAAAPLAGRLSDAGHGRFTVGIALTIMLLAVALLWNGAYRLPLLIAGIVLLDLGGTANHISNQARVYTVRPEARNRIKEVQTHAEKQYFRISDPMYSAEHQG